MSAKRHLLISLSIFSIGFACVSCTSIDPNVTVTKKAVYSRATAMPFGEDVITLYSDSSAEYKYFSVITGHTEELLGTYKDSDQVLKLNFGWLRPKMVFQILGSGDLQPTSSSAGSKEFKRISGAGP
ncbi:MAG: hypothetical protein PCFJNLEI_01985 [Verrucomicrobiae bacterium]|nr:hypothetical protein [Verrucomicrobiae bacterium]